MNKIALFIRNPKGALVLASAFPMMAFAQTSNPLTDALSGVDLAGAATAIGALVLLVLGIAMAFKGADVGKRAVRKV